MRGQRPAPPSEEEIEAARDRYIAAVNAGRVLPVAEMVRVDADSPTPGWPWWLDGGRLHTRGPAKTWFNPYDCTGGAR